MSNIKQNNVNYLNATYIIFKISYLCDNYEHTFNFETISSKNQPHRMH